MLPFLEPFVNPFGDEPFFEDIPKTYKRMWKMREQVADWAFGVN